MPSTSRQQERSNGIEIEVEISNEPRTPQQIEAWRRLCQRWREMVEADLRVQPQAVAQTAGGKQ